MTREVNDDLRISTDILLRSENAATRYGITEIELRIGGLNTVGRTTINAQPQGNSFVRVVFRSIDGSPAAHAVTQFVPTDVEFIRPLGNDDHILVRLHFDLGVPLPSTVSPGSASIDLNLHLDT